MKNNIFDNIIKWKATANIIVRQFLVDYFEDDSPDFWWVNDDIGGVFSYGDYFFSFDVPLKCYELDISKEDLTNWYDFCLENHSVNISLAKFILSPQERKEAEEKHLTELKERVEMAEKEFQKAIDEYTSKNNI